MVAAALASVGVASTTALASTTSRVAVKSITVLAGQTLWSIASTYHTSVNALLKLNPSIHGDSIQIGMKLVIAKQAPSAPHSAPMNQRITIRSGDTLWSLAAHYHTTVGRLETLNPQLRGSQTIRVGDTLWVSGRGAATGTSMSKLTTVSTQAKLSSRADGFGPSGAAQAAEDLYWMARVIHAEANGQPLNAQIAVGDVVWHRMQGQPGSTVKEIVFQQSNGSYQFSTVPEGYIYGTPDALSQEAAVDVLENHTDLVPGAYVFYGIHQANDSWVLSQPVVAHIGDFVFAK